MLIPPAVVYPPARTGGRKAAAHAHGRDTILGTAFGDPDGVASLVASLVAFIEGADPSALGSVVT
ncbi:hypothetical protein [Streptomyces phaeofaciens]|uniref:hypothetical protein n=1 Tax=Streptomyces phaeofaciens TaxID=68254 RepID=UPI0036C06E4D